MGGGTGTGGLGDAQRRTSNRRASDKGLKSRAAHGVPRARLPWKFWKVDEHLERTKW